MKSEIDCFTIMEKSAYCSENEIGEHVTQKTNTAEEGEKRENELHLRPGENGIDKEVQRVKDKYLSDKPAQQSCNVGSCWRKVKKSQHVDFE